MKLSELLKSETADEFKMYIDDVEIDYSLTGEEVTIVLANDEIVEAEDLELQTKPGYDPEKMIFEVEDVAFNTKHTLRVTVERTATFEDWHDAKVKLADCKAQS